MMKNVCKRAQAEFFTPLFAPILESKWQTYALASFAILHVGCILLGWGGFWRCPIESATGIPCPGCYLSTAIGYLLKGRWVKALETHLFAPVFLFGILLVVAVCLLPEAPRRVLVQQTARLERRTGIVAFVLAGLMVYWGLRLFWFGFG